MKIKNLAVLLICLMIISMPSIGQGWATVDTRLLMILHPQMGNFDYSNGRFFRKPFSPDRNNKLYEELNKAEKRARKSIDSLKRNEHKLIQRRIDLLIERDNTLNDLSRKAASSTYNLKGKYKRVAEYEKRFDKKLADLDIQLAQTHSKMEFVTDQAYSPIYLTKIETTNRLIDIKRSIKKITEQVASQLKISVVMDTSFGMRPSKPENKATSIFLQDENFDLLSSSLFHNLTTFEINLPPNAKAAKITNEHVALGSAYSKLTVLKKLSQLRSLLIPFATEYTPGSIFLVGGNNITAYVAQKIFEEYKVPENLKKSYLALIGKFENIENSNYEESPPRYPNQVIEEKTK